MTISDIKRGLKGFEKDEQKEETKEPPKLKRLNFYSWLRDTARLREQKDLPPLTKEECDLLHQAYIAGQSQMQHAIMFGLQRQQMIEMAGIDRNKIKIDGESNDVDLSDDTYLDELLKSQG